MNAKTAQAHGYLANKSKRIAEICEVFGMTEHARDARNRQQGMLEDLHEEAIVENHLRDL